MKKNCEEIEGGVSLCQSYKNSQIFFVVGTGVNHTDWPTNKLFIWDNLLKKKMAALEFVKPIIDLKMVGDWILIAQEDKVTPLNFSKNLSDI